MSHIRSIGLATVVLFGLITRSALAQQPMPQMPPSPQEPRTKHVRPPQDAEVHAAGGFLFEEFHPINGDPMDARIFKLKNGLTVYLSVNKSEPRVQTMIAVRAGSKYDPEDATGLAHYLEHLLFKGTDKFGSLDYTKEKPYLDTIENLYEVYRSTTDTNARKAIYHAIDSVSGIAAKWAIANEYDKMVSGLGAKGTNAFTSDEETVYVNDIPSNEIGKWLRIEAERYRHPVLRLFHTELEAVYEEKNRGLDNDDNQAWEALMAALFQKHPYGQHTTIGTIHDLKNPSIKKIKDFYSKWYIPNNMAIIMSGDFNPDSVIRLIVPIFSTFHAKKLQDWTAPVEAPLTQPVVRDVYGPDAEFMEMAWRFPGINTHEAKVLKMLDLLLSNSTAGLIDLNLNQQQKLLEASTDVESNNDYCEHVLEGKAKDGQSLDSVRDLLLSQIDLVKEGKFDANLLPAIINDLTIQKLREYERNGGRASVMMNAFIHHVDWKDQVAELDSLSKITKKEIVDFANKYYDNNFAIVYKHTGERRDVVKVTKPPITPVEVNRSAQSDFLKSIDSMKVPPIEPHFLDYKQDVKQGKLTNGVPIYYKNNDENTRFMLSYVIEMGKRNDKNLKYALDYMDYIGTDKLSPAALKTKLFSLGASLSTSVSDDEAHISISGLQKNFKESVKLMESILKSPTSDDQTLHQYVNRTIKGREDSKKDRNTILYGALRNYAEYGKVNPQTFDLTNSDLQHLALTDLTGRIHSICDYPHHILYYGPDALSDLTASLNKLHIVPEHRTAPVPVEYVHQETNKNKIYFVDYDMAQAEVIMLSKGLPMYDPTKAPAIAVYNEYYGGSMASVTFQTIRESKALAYAVYSSYSSGQKKDDPYYIFSYVGSQADKTPESMKSMFEILDTMPRADKLFAQSKESMMNTLASDRTTRENVLWSYERAKKLGLDHDIRADVYAQAPSITFDQLADFQKQNIANHQYAIAVIGSKSKVDMKALGQFGDIQELSLDEIFGY
jgi:predicted Zn-dependent peptidase